MSRFLITFGIILIVAGLLWPWLQKLGFGRLPGDIVIERENFRLYVPIVTSLFVSLVLSLLLWCLNRNYRAPAFCARPCGSVPSPRLIFPSLACVVADVFWPRLLPIGRINLQSGDPSELPVNRQRPVRRSVLSEASRSYCIGWKRVKSACAVTPSPVRASFGG